MSRSSAARVSPAGPGTGPAPAALSDAERARRKSAAILRARERAEHQRRLASGCYPVPRHVQHCASQGGRLWWIWRWRRSDGSPTHAHRSPYFCRSWRCAHCAAHEAEVLYSRIREAVTRSEYAPDGWCLLVLTIDRSRGPWSSLREAYGDLGAMTEAFFRRLRRWQNASGWTETGSAWVATVEAHRTGWPHLNILLYSPELAGHLETRRLAMLAGGASDRESRLAGGWLLELIVGAGWGAQSSAERARSAEKLSSYIVKLAAVSEASAGELAKLTQAPLAAPPRFRRLRSGKAFLPPRHKGSGEWTGALVRRIVDRLTGTTCAQPVHQGDVAHRATIARCCASEDDILHAERTGVFFDPVSRDYRPHAAVGAGLAPVAVSLPPVRAG